jgi:hypothetical protein
MANYSANFTTANSTGAAPASASNVVKATADATGANVHARKIDDVTLFATVCTLAAAWLVAVFGLSLTIKPDYLGTFVSLQTGCNYTQRYFLDHEGNDARRVEIFIMNERQWQAIRDLVRQWVLSVYATWQALMPAFFTTNLQARIPDDFMPAQVVQELDAQAPDGRRPTLQNMGLLRRMSYAAPVDVPSDSDRGVRSPSQLPNPPSVTDGRVSSAANSASTFAELAPREPAASAAITSATATTAAGPGTIEVGAPMSLFQIAGEGRGSLFKPSHSADVLAVDDYQTMPEEGAHADGAVQSGNRHS